MGLHINEEAPNFTAETTEGPINFHEWIGNGLRGPFCFHIPRILRRCAPPNWVTWRASKANSTSVIAK